MQKEQLTTQLIGAIVLHTEFGQGIIVKAEAKDNNVIIDIQFAQNKKSYAAFIAIEKGVVSFVDNQYYLIVDNLKTIYDEEKKPKEIKSEVKIGSKNNDIILLTELLKAGKSITHKLIGLYNNVEFEADLFACGSELFFKKMNGGYLSNDDLYVIMLYLSYIALIEYDGEFHGKVVESLSLLAKRSIDSNTVRNTIYESEQYDAYLIDAKSYKFYSCQNLTFYKCKKCHKVTLYNVNNTCVEGDCDGELECCDVEKDSLLQNNYYRNEYIKWMNWILLEF